MSDDKKYYYLRMKESFFDEDKMVVLESMPDGYLYSNILLKLYLKSIKNNGKLMLNDYIPYNPQMIATITRHPVGVVEKAIQIFEKIGIVDVLDNGTIYMLDIQEYIGKTSTESDRKREYRRKIEEEKAKQMGHLSGQCDLEIELEKDIDKEIDKEKEIKKKKPQPTEPKKTFGSYKNVRLTDSQLQKLNIDYGEAKTSQAIEFLSGYRQEKGYKSKEDYLSLKRWVYKALDEHSGKRKPLEVSDNKRDYDFDAIERGLIN